MMKTPNSNPAIVNFDTELQSRFWYWNGASGKRYIHSVYSPELCPALPGSIFIRVRRAGVQRIAVAAGRFLPIWDSNVIPLDKSCQHGVIDEVHVHLLASNDRAAETILQDLCIGADLPLPTTFNAARAAQVANKIKSDGFAEKQLPLFEVFCPGTPATVGAG